MVHLQRLIRQLLDEFYDGVAMGRPQEALEAFDEVVRIHSTRGLDVVSSPIWDLEGAACIASRLVPSVLSLHSTYKFVLRTKKLYAHDEVNELREGDRVRVQETRPTSKLKRWRVIEVLERAR